jgi:hypothetical protein
MNLIAKTLGALALNLLALIAWVIILALCLWLLVPQAFPALNFGLSNAFPLAGLLLIAKALFVVE